MRLVKPSGASRPTIGEDAFRQLRDVGERLDYIVQRYRRLVMDVAEGHAVPEVRDSLDAVNGQMVYVARRLQELLVARYEQGDQGRGAEEYPESIAVG